MTQIEHKRFDRRILLLLAPGFIWLVLFLFLPLIIMLLYSFGTMKGASMDLGTTEFTLSNYKQLFHNPLYQKVLLNSLELSAKVVILSLFFGYATAYWLARRSEIVKFVFLCLLLVPFWTSVLLRTYSWILMLQRKGAVNAFLLSVGAIESPLEILWSEASVVVACLQIYMPFMIIPIFAVLDMQNWKLVEAARNLGASRLRAFWEITLPLSRPGVVVGVLFVFVPVVGEYLVPAMLGGTSFPVASEVIESQFGQAFNWPLGCALSVILSFLICGVVFTLLKIYSPWKLLLRRT